VLLTDLIYVLVVTTLVLRRIFQMIADRRSRSAGSRLHLRLTGVFAIVALIPTVLVAVFGVLTVNIGLEGWFSDRVSGVIGASLSAAQAYEAEQAATLTDDVAALAAGSQSRETAQFPDGRRHGAPDSGAGPGSHPAWVERGLSDRRDWHAEDARREELSFRL
jgi:two-component system, NtrC family, nitrogen regulation sensor histidine kinase NtrY